MAGLISERNCSASTAFPLCPAKPTIPPKAPRAWPDRLKAQRTLRPFYLVWVAPEGCGDLTPPPTVLRLGERALDHATQ